MHANKLLTLFFIAVSSAALADSAPQNSPATADATIIAGVTPNTGIEENKQTDFTLHLHRKKNNQPVTSDDLQEMHTQKIHLLIIDPSLTDYHHQHPIPTQVPGSYRFSITPKKAGDYIAFAEILPNETTQTLYLPTHFEVTGKAEPVTPNPDVKPGQLQKNQEVNGLLFTTKIDTDSIQAKQAYELQIHVTDAKTQQPIKSLEPVMGAFAHMVGFSADRKQVVHVHPMGAEPNQASDRGGPDLTFHVQFPTAGFYRLFAQVQVNGQMIFVPLDVQVK